MSAAGQGPFPGDRCDSFADALRRAGLDPDRANRLEQMQHHIVSARSDELVREPGTMRPEMMFVRAGLLCKVKLSGDGSRKIVALRFPGEPILPRLGPAPYGLLALARSELFVADGRELMMIVEADPGLMKILWAVIQRNEAIAHEWLINRGRRSGAARVIHLLLETCVRSGVDIGNQSFRIPFKQEHIAQITGQTSTNVSKVLAEMTQARLIERNGRELRFRQLAELRRIADFNPAYLRYPTA